MYLLNTPLKAVKGIGQTTANLLAKQGVQSVQDLLLFAPLRYEDRSHFSNINQVPEEKVVTILATVNSTKTFYKNNKSIHTAVVKDDTGSLTLMWFNNRYILHSIKKNEQYYFSGKVAKNRIMLQPTAEKAETLSSPIHTNRLVPIYSSKIKIKQGLLRRYLNTILTNFALLSEDNESKNEDLIQNKITNQLSSLEAFKQLHFPDDQDKIIMARERLALEELLGLIQHSQKLKKEWKKLANAISLITPKKLIPSSIPFDLTTSQHQALQEIIQDINKKKPMNRLLIGDVGSGKTIVAGLALRVATLNNTHACLVVPTQMLAEQHFQTFIEFFPEEQIIIATGKGVFQHQSSIKQNINQSNSKLQPPKKIKTAKEIRQVFSKPSIIIGTHAVLNLIRNKKITNDIKIGCLVFDEQHRFGVEQRAVLADLDPQPHLLTMTATPIPRSLMLTIFAHLSLSIITQLPKNRIPTKTWFVKEEKRKSMLEWLNTKIEEGKQSDNPFQILVICPFIDPSTANALENIAAVNQTFIHINQEFKTKGHLVGLLHAKLTQKEKDSVIEKLYKKEIDILVATPMVEVGIDLPQASAIVIEAAERFGLASLHQLRGRVGRAGQQGYCLLFTTNESNRNSITRIKLLEKINDGQVLAQKDLEHRGAGNIFGTMQHGFEDLRFASWSNLDLIATAQNLSPTLPKGWQSVVPVQNQNNALESQPKQKLIAAN